MDARIIASLVKSFGIEPEKLLSDAKSFAERIAEQHKSIDDRMTRIECRVEYLITLLEKNGENSNG